MNAWWVTRKETRDGQGSVTVKIGKTRDGYPRDGSVTEKGKGNELLVIII